MPRKLVAQKGGPIFPVPRKLVAQQGGLGTGKMV